jgi:hypothetical protein
MPLEVQDRVVTAQAAHHLLQALYCRIHVALPCDPMSVRSKRRATHDNRERLRQHRRISGSE